MESGNANPAVESLLEQYRREIASLRKIIEDLQAPRHRHFRKTVEEAVQLALDFDRPPDPPRAPKPQPKPPALLAHKSYFLTRWCCAFCGWFETGEAIGIQAANCPQCRRPADFVDRCKCSTTRDLPFISRPRATPNPAPDDGSFQVSRTTGVTSKFGSDARARRRAGLKATGRKRKNLNPEPQVKRDYTIWDDEEK